MQHCEDHSALAKRYVPKVTTRGPSVAVMGEMEEGVAGLW